MLLKLREQVPVCHCNNQRACWDQHQQQTNFPSHNAALQCFDISHKTQLAFQIRALTFSWRQADWYLHNLDGLSLLCCPWPFVSNVHTQTTTEYGFTSVTAGRKRNKITSSEAVTECSGEKGYCRLVV